MTFSLSSHLLHLPHVFVQEGSTTYVRPPDTLERFQAITVADDHVCGYRHLEAYAPEFTSLPQVVRLSELFSVNALICMR